MAWISTDPEAQRQIQDFQLSTSEWRQVRQRSGNALRAGSKEGPVGVGEHSATWTSKEIIGQVIPTYRECSTLCYLHDMLLTMCRPVDPNQA